MTFLDNSGVPVSSAGSVLIAYPRSLLWPLCSEDSGVAFCFKQESVSCQDRDVGLAALCREVSPWAVSQLVRYGCVWRALCSATWWFQQGHKEISALVRCRGVMGGE